MIILTPVFTNSNQCQVATFHLKNFASINKIAISFFFSLVNLGPICLNLATQNLVDKESYRNAKCLLISQDIIPKSWQRFVMSIPYFLRLVWLYLTNFLMRKFQYYFTWSEDPFRKWGSLHYQRYVENVSFFKHSAKKRDPISLSYTIISFFNTW